MDLREVGCDDRDWINLAQDRDRWRAYQDGATAHTAENSVAVLRRMFPGHIISRRGDIPWPSARLTLPSATTFCGVTEVQSVRRQAPNNDDLKIAIAQEIANIDVVAGLVSAAYVNIGHMTVLQILDFASVLRNLLFQMLLSNAPDNRKGVLLDQLLMLVDLYKVVSTPRKTLSEREDSITRPFNDFLLVELSCSFGTCLESLSIIAANLQTPRRSASKERKQARS
ncbi:hypothetical protein ANN_11221 [Periplaneta americana]|uniref:Uncharacterized protein n=1 Tax=Periplaneta americana TaxID=6978 RepID=A0ABQ8T5K5_PERAM|nr:hypothetical protein ANN_11221 [Periplaneta americana]